MIVFDISEPRFVFMEYLKTVNIEYSPDKFLKFLSGSLFRICGINVETYPPYNQSYQDLLVANVAHLDAYITKVLPMDYMCRIHSTGFVGDYYLIKVVGNSGILYHVSESNTVSNTV